ncbi:helix-turn-helix transcriptional regulator [Runella sp.]|uniref:helix-turn-helix transcriptional regulator n=1 Tax=Runella sp. TaxID=1960881 RepID=UPI003D119B29
MDKKRLERLFAIHQKLRTMQAYTAQTLIEAIAEKVEQHISDRTLRDDIQDLRDMGAEIPKRAKSYRYVVPFSFLEKLDDSYYGSLNEAVALLRQVSKTKEFLGLEDILLRLEQRLSLTDAEKNAAIAFEEVELNGKEHLPQLYQAIQNRRFVRVNYEPFGKPKYQRHIFPLLLKEYNNRWFLIGWENGKNNIQNLPLDRIGHFHETHETFGYDKYFDWRERFTHMIGTTLEGTLETVRLRFSEGRLPYVMTKKLHCSQQPLGERTISIQVYTNRELIAKILEFGADVEVLEPKELRKKIAETLRSASVWYEG